MRDGSMKYYFIFIFAISLICIVGLIFQQYNEEQKYNAKREEARQLGITEAVVGGVRIICQRGQNCICITTWDEKQLECKFAN